MKGRRVRGVEGGGRKRGGVATQKKQSGQRPLAQSSKQQVSSTLEKILENLVIL